MAVCVVNLLEAIEIEAYDGGQIAAARSRSQCLLHAILQQQPVWQAGKSIVICLMEKPFMQLLALGNILRQRETRLSPFKKNGVRSYLNLDAAAIFFQVGPGTGDGGGLSQIFQTTLELSDIFRQTDVAKRHS